MTTEDRSRTLLEDLPTEIFFQIFGFLDLQELVTAFSGLNSHINSIIRSLRDVSLIVRYNDTNGLKLLQSFSDRISHLSVLSVEAVDLTSFPKLRSLMLKYGSYAQWDSIRPENMPLLESLHIAGFRKGLTVQCKRRDDLFDVIFADGFSQLRRCIADDIGCFHFNSAWTGSSSLRTLNLCLGQTADTEKLRAICPQLNRFTTKQFLRTFDQTKVGSNLGKRRLPLELRRLEQLELENKFIMTADSLGIFENRKLPARFNNTTASKTESPCQQGSAFLQGRIFPQTDPYCQASFLFEIRLAPEYPLKRPEIVSLDPMYHPNIYDGMNRFDWPVCWDSSNYKPTTLLAEILEEVIGTLDKLYDKYLIVNAECASEYQRDYDAFYKKALDMTLSYGRPRC